MLERNATVNKSSFEERQMMLEHDRKAIWAKLRLEMAREVGLEADANVDEKMEAQRREEQKR